MSLVPDVFKALIRLDTAAKKGLPESLINLIKVRASQLNHCAFCLDMHSKDALAAGESTERIIQLSAWSESKHFYTAREIAAIELTKAVTVLTDGFVPDDVYARAAKEFDETAASSHVMGWSPVRPRCSARRADAACWAHGVVQRGSSLRLLRLSGCSRVSGSRRTWTHTRSAG